MSVKPSAPPLASLPSSQAALESASAPLGELAAKVANQYKALVQARHEMALQAGENPLDEEQFFLDAVTQLSEDHARVEQSIRNLKKQNKTNGKIKRVARQLQYVLHGATPAVPVHAPSCAPQANPDAITRTRNAIAALSQFLNTGSNDAAEKQRLISEMFNAFKAVKKNDDPDFRMSPTFLKLQKAHDSLLEQALAPAVPAETQARFLKALKTFANETQESAAKGDLVREYIDTQLQERALSDQIPALKRNIAKKLNASRQNQEGAFEPNNLCYIDPQYGQIPTPFSKALEQLGTPSNQLLAQQYAALSPHIDTRYKAIWTKGDGNCLFHSIAYLTNIDHVTMRQGITQHMLDNPDLYKDLIRERLRNDPAVAAGMYEFSGTLVERYVAYMQQDSIWGGKPELQALSNILGRPIIVRQTGAITATLSFFPTTGELKNRSPLLFLNKGECHFEPLVPR